MYYVLYSYNVELFSGTIKTIESLLYSRALFIVLTPHHKSIFQSRRWTELNRKEPQFSFNWFRIK